MEPNWCAGANRGVCWVRLAAMPGIGRVVIGLGQNLTEPWFDMCF